jgi:hypothetical protein
MRNIGTRAQRPPAGVGGLAHGLDEQAGRLERAGVGLQRQTPSLEGELETGALHRGAEPALLQVALGDGVRLVVAPRPGVGQGMGDARAQPPAGCEHAGGLAHRRRHVGDVHQAVVGDDEVEGAVVEGQCLGGALDVAAGRIGLRGGAQQRGRGVEAGHAMSARDEVAGHAALAAADLERRGAGLGTRAKKASR